MRPLADFDTEYDWIDLKTIARETRTAKYPHKCYVCGRVIRPATRYSRIFSIVDGEPQVQKFHGYAIGECARSA